MKRMIRLIAVVSAVSLLGTFTSGSMRQVRASEATSQSDDNTDEEKPESEMTEEEKAEKEKAKKIAEYKKYLFDTDYIVLKIAEAVADNNSEEVEKLKTTYTTELAKRKEAREKINELEVK